MRSVQGDTAGALKSFQAALAIRERLAASDPRNTQWQRDLSRSFGRIGDVQSAQGDTTGALKSYQATLAVVDERLAASDPRNSLWQRDIAIVCWKQASLGPGAGSTDDRRVILRKGLNILIALRERGQLPASDTGWIKTFEDALQRLK